MDIREEKLKGFKGKMHCSWFSKENEVSKDVVLFPIVPDLWSQREILIPCANPGSWIIIVDQYNFWASQQLFQGTGLAFINRYMDLKS